MCGIAGVVSSGPLSPVDHARVRAMNARLEHRGPDGTGSYANDHAALSMRRLSIIDLTGGWQPLYNEDRSIILVANGEVYNFIELRRDLERRGHRFTTKSDCETIAHLYEERGLDFVHDLRGMYAVALLDQTRRRFVLVRDRMGEKPLYLHERRSPEGHHQIWYASELKSILASGVVPFQFDEAALDDFFHFQWANEPQAAIKGVRKLPAGHLLSVDIDPWKVTERCYWRMEDAPAIDADPVPTIRKVLDEVCELIIRSDVPVGVALSGGLDSSAIAALAATKYPGTMHAFTIGWKGRPWQDERSNAKDLADHLKLPFHEAEVDPVDMVRFFPELNRLRDDPISDVAGHGYYLVNKMARDNGCPVLLQGQGGDELFWGYPWARRSVRETEYFLQHNTPRRPSLGEQWLPRGFDRPSLIEWTFRAWSMWEGWRPWWRSPISSRDQLIFGQLQDSYLMGSLARRQIFTPEFNARLASVDSARSFTIPSPRASTDILVTKLQCEGYLLENGIAQGDRLSMASSVELRLPLVDYKLVETVIGLRKNNRDVDEAPKHWFRKAVEDVVPEWVRARPKRGFNPPVSQWLAALREAYGPELQHGVLVDLGVLRPGAAARLASKNPRASAWTSLSTSALVMEFWARAMIEEAREGAARFAAELQAPSAPTPAHNGARDAAGVQTPTAR